MSVIAFNCSGCGQAIEAPAEMAGQVAQCPSCGNEVTIPADTVDGADVAWASSAGGNTCSSCGAEMGTGAVLCVQCGYHVELGKKIDTKL